MKFAKVLTLEQVEQWKDRYIDFYLLKQCLLHHTKLLGDVLGESIEIETEAKEGEDVKRLKRDSMMLNKDFGTFEAEFADEVAKVEVFFKSRYDKFSARLQELTNEIDLMKRGTATTARGADALRKAYHDSHVHWKLLRKFQETNKYGFVKILKKYDRATGEHQFDYFLETYLQSTTFWCSHAIDDVLTESKDTYIKYFAASDERLAKGQLRASDPKRIQSNMFFASLFFGAVLFMFIICLYTWLRHYPAKPDNFANIGWFFYRMTFLPIELGIMFSCSAYIWEKYNINYVFIFRFNPAHYRSPLMYLKYCFFALSMWALSFYIFMEAVVYDEKTFFGLLHPLIFLVCTGIIFFMPLPMMGYYTRFYLLKRISRVLRAGLPGRVNVSFADFIMAICMISLAGFFLQFQTMFCIFQTHNDVQCNSSAFFPLPILTAVPHWCRMFQCVRRWWQTGMTYPHLASAVRPASTLIGLLLLELYRWYPDAHWLVNLWLSWNIVFSTVRWYSDILIDFGFVKFGLDFSLRKQRLYPTWVYYVVMVDNYCLRYVWLVTYMLRTRAGLNLTHPVLLLFISSFEVFWGAQFIFFRMENEHFNCPDRYNIIQDVPLPFSKKYDALARKNALKNTKKEQKASKAKTSILNRIVNKWKNIGADPRKKLHESIAAAIQEVERTHSHPQQIGKPFPSLVNLNKSTSSPYITSALHPYRLNPSDSSAIIAFPLRTNPSTSLHLNSVAHTPGPSPPVTPRREPSEKVVTFRREPSEKFQAQNPGNNLIHNPGNNLAHDPGHSHAPHSSPHISPSPSPHPSPPPSPRALLELSSSLGGSTD